MSRTNALVRISLLVTVTLSVLAVAVPWVSARTADTAGWNSGWVTVAPGAVQTLTHNLGGDPDTYAVELLFMDTDTSGRGINACYYGGIEVNGGYQGAAWQHLTASTIQVVRGADDTVADKVRVRIWVPDPAPTYVSPWTPVAQHQEVNFAHGLGEPSADYAVGLTFKSPQNGVNQRGYGGIMLSDGRWLGAEWYQLDAQTVKVHRNPDDAFAGQVRVSVTVPEPAQYDSGWVTLAPGAALTLSHALGGDPGSYRVRLGAKDTDGDLGCNQVGAGGIADGQALAGYHWEQLTADTIRVVREAADTYAEQVRIRIWAPATARKIFLPFAARKASHAVQPTELAYDDGLADSLQSQDVGAGFAVRFTTPGASARLTSVRYFLNATAASTPIEVHVWDAAHNDLCTPFTAIPVAGQSWLTVDLSARNVTVSGDFYVGYLYTVGFVPDIGVDTTAPDGRSFEVPWEAVGSDYMIRATLAP